MQIKKPFQLSRDATPFQLNCILSLLFHFNHSQPLYKSVITAFLQPCNPRAQPCPFSILQCTTKWSLLVASIYYVWCNCTRIPLPASYSLIWSNYLIESILITPIINVSASASASVDDEYYCSADMQPQIRRWIHCKARERQTRSNPIRATADTFHRAASVHSFINSFSIIIINYRHLSINENHIIDPQFAIIVPMVYSPHPTTTRQYVYIHDSSWCGGEFAYCGCFLAAKD